MSVAMSDKDALAQFIAMPVSKGMISHLAKKASAVIRCEQSPHQQSRMLPTPPDTPPPSEDGSSNFSTTRQPSLPTLETFITSLVERSHVQVPTLMSALVYLDRLKKKLPPAAKGVRCTVHRIFLASLILAAKYLNDSSPKNKHWARYSVVRGFEGFGFSLTEVNLMEKQLLMLLDWDLRITEMDLCKHLEPFLTPIKARHQKVQEQKAKEQARLEFEEQIAAIRRRELQQQQRSRPPYSPSIASSSSTASSSSLYLPPTPGGGSPSAEEIAIRSLTPMSGRSSRASESPDYMNHKARKHSNQSNYSKYLYPTPPMSIPSSSQIPALDHPDSAASSTDNSPDLSPSIKNRRLVITSPLDHNTKQASTKKMGIFSRFFAAEKQQIRGRVAA